MKRGMDNLAIGRRTGRNAMLAQRGQMLGGTGAAIGDEQKIVGQFQRVSPAVIRFLDAGVAVAIAVEEVTGDGHGAEISDDGGQTELQHFVCGEIVAHDVECEAGAAG